MSTGSKLTKGSQRQQREASVNKGKPASTKGSQRQQREASANKALVNSYDFNKAHQ
jgi:hypothetical protein